MKASYISVMMLTASVTVGCANVHVKKVSVDKRINGQDDHVKGFRYYVSRPYIVIDQAIPVTTTQWMARLVQVTEKDSKTHPLPPELKDPQNPTGPVYLLEGVAPEPGQGVRYYDKAGNTINRVNRNDYQVVTVTAAAKTDASDATKKDASAAKKDAGAAVPAATDATKKDQTPAAPQPVANPTDAVPKILAPPPPNPMPIPPTVKPPGSVELKPGVDPRELMSAIRTPQDAQIQKTQGAGSSAGSPFDKSAPTVVPPGGGNSAAQTAAALVQAQGQNQANAAQGGDSPPPASADHIQVIFLPDFEEQLAISHRNFAAYNKYELHFNDGWQLDGYSANFNATQVPVAILQTIQNIIGAVTSFESAAIKAQPAPAPKGAPDQAFDVAIKTAPTTNEFWFTMKKITQIDPGIYRVQKSWEKVTVPDSSIAPSVASGLLSDLGVPLVETIQVISINP